MECALVYGEQKTYIFNSQVSRPRGAKSESDVKIIVRSWTSRLRTKWDEILGYLPWGNK